MQIEKLIVGQLQTNCYLVWDEKSREAIIIDPADDGDYIIGKIQNLELKPKLILATHGHVDHILAVTELKLAFDIPFLMHRGDLFLLKRTRETARYFMGIVADPPPKVDKFIKERDLIEFGKEEVRRLSKRLIRGCATPPAAERRPDLTSGLAAVEMKVIETPGHSPGGVALYTRGVLFSGDTLFRRGVGRTDFSYACQKELIKSIKKLFDLPEDTKVYPGHGEETTIGEEKPYLQGFLWP